MHAMNIFRACFNPHQNNLIALIGAFFSFICCKHNHTASRPGRGWQAAGYQLSGCIWIKGGMEKLIQTFRGNPVKRLGFCDQFFFCHLHSDIERRFGSAFSASGLKHI